MIKVNLTSIVFGRVTMPCRAIEFKAVNSMSTMQTYANIVLITPNNLANYVKEPLHEAFSYLSLTHKADYLRCYFMHYFGGGYTDIKAHFKSWQGA